MNIIENLLDIIRSGKSFSDILLEAEAPIMLKTPRGWVDAEVFEYPSMEDLSLFLENIEPAWESLIIKGAIRRPLDLHTTRMRVNAYLAFAGKKLMASIRLVPAQAPTIQATGMPQSTRLLLENPGGIILISGSTGAGKTTSMAAMLDTINIARPVHIITLEDPIEFLYERKKAVFSQREIIVDCESFAKGVNDAMSQRPDVIGIGEIRDRDTAEQALLAGESGHLVIATIHANSAAGTLSKMMGFFGSAERETRLQSLSSSLVGVMHQTLIPRKDGQGHALAVDFIANHKRQYSSSIGSTEKVQSMLDRKGDDGVSVGLGESVLKLIADGIVDKADAAKAVSGNASVYEKIKNA